MGLAAGHRVVLLADAVELELSVYPVAVAASLLRLHSSVEGSGN
ncbi:hypothetical protein [Nocardia sp. NPDC050793]